MRIDPTKSVQKHKSSLCLFCAIYAPWTSRSSWENFGIWASDQDSWAKVFGRTCYYCVNIKLSRNSFDLQKAETQVNRQIRDSSVFKKFIPSQVLQIGKRNIKFKIMLMFISVVKTTKITWKNCNLIYSK